MFLIDHYLFRIYRTYVRLDKLIRLYRGPVSEASSTATIVPGGIMFSLSVFTGVWNGEDKIGLKFVSVLLILAVMIVSGFYFEKRILKIRHVFKDKSKIGKILSILVVNLFLAIFYSILFISFREIRP